jgi:hypothetical protein
MTEQQDPDKQPADSDPNETDAPEEAGGVGLSGSVSNLGEVRTPPIAKKREDVRAHLAKILAYLFLAIVIALFVSSVFGGQQWTRVQEFSQIAFGVVAAVVGTIIGFYFGSQR